MALNYQQSDLLWRPDNYPKGIVGPQNTSINKKWQTNNNLGEFEESLNKST